MARRKERCRVCKGPAFQFRLIQGLGVYRDMPSKPTGICDECKWEREWKEYCRTGVEPDRMQKGASVTQ